MLCLCPRFQLKKNPQILIKFCINVVLLEAKYSRSLFSNENIAGEGIRRPVGHVVQ
jgi:hypothetical protein